MSMQVEEGAIIETADAVATEASSAPADASAQPADAGASQAAPAQVDPQPQAAAPGQTQPAQPAPQPAQFRQPNREARRNQQLANENRDLRERIARIEGRFEASAPQQSAPAANDDPEPNPEDFPGGEFSKPYWQAWNRWDRRQAEKAAEAERPAREAAARQTEEQTRAFNEGAKRFADTMERAEARGWYDGADFLAQLDRAGKRDLIDDITECENPEAVAQWLATPKTNSGDEEYRRGVIGMKGRKLTRELGRIDDMLGDYIASARKQPAGASAQPPAQAAPTPKPQPDPAPKVNGTSPKQGASGGGYDQLFAR